MSEAARRVFKTISRRYIPSKHIVPGYGPSKCPICGSTSILHKFIPSPAWTEKRLVTAGIEVKVKHPAGEEERPVYYCGECGFIISRAFREKETISFEAPIEEAYVVEDVNGQLHYLVTSNPEDPVRPFYGSVSIREAKRVVPEKPMSALIVHVDVDITYKTQNGEPTYCEFHETREIVKTKVEVYREYTTEELNCFRSLITRRGSGYTVKDGALAYLVCCLRGTKSLTTGFLRASDFSGFRDVSDSTVGEALSRIQSLGITPPEFGGLWRVAYEKVDGYRASYIPVNYILREKEYIIRREAAERIKEKRDWWTVLNVSAREVPGQLGLEKWF